MLESLQHIQGVISSEKPSPVAVAVYLEAANKVLLKYLDSTQAQIKGEQNAVQSFLRKMLTKVELYGSVVSFLEALQPFAEASFSSKGPENNRSPKMGVSLLNRAVVLSSAVCHIVRRDIQTLTFLMISWASQEPEAVSATLRALTSRHSSVIAGQLSKGQLCDLAEMYVELQSQIEDSDIQEVAKGNLAELLEAVDWAGSRVITYLAPYNVSKQLVPWERYDSTGSPALVDTELRLRGSILALWCLEEDIWSEGLRHRINIWVRILYEASNERTVSAL